MASTDYTKRIKKLCLAIDKATTVQQKLNIFILVQETTNNAIKEGVTWLPKEEREKYNKVGG